MNSSTERSRAQEPGPSTEPDRKVEVLVSEGTDGRRQVLLRDLSFGQGIGWYAQKTIRLDPEQVEALMRSLCCARQGCAVAAAKDRVQEASAARIIQISSLHQG